MLYPPSSYHRAARPKWHERTTLRSLFSIFHNLRRIRDSHRSSDFRQSTFYPQGSEPVGTSFDNGLPIATLARDLQSNGRRVEPRRVKGVSMLYYALVFLLVAVIAGVFGFGMVAFAAAEIARICFFVFIALFLISLLSHFFQRSSHP